MARLLGLHGLLLLRGVALETECQTTLLQMDLSMRKAPHWYPMRGVDQNRSGSSRATGPFPLRRPSWEYGEPLLSFHQTPCIDGQQNIYTGSDTGRIISLDKTGKKRWEKQGTSANCENPALFDDVLYASCGDGSVLALQTADGQLLWQRKVCDEMPSDAYSMTASEHFLFVPCGRSASQPWGAGSVGLLHRENGEMLWRYDLPFGTATVNLAPCMLADSVIFNDQSGGIYRLKLSDGSLMWMTSGYPSGFTLGGVACSKDGLVFNGFSTGPIGSGEGGLQALSLDGQLLWTKWHQDPVHNAPAVGQIYGHGLAVVYGLGTPASGVGTPPRYTNGTIVAVDAYTGETLWTYEPPAWYGSGAASSTFLQPCAPDLFSSATFASDGTVYINWSIAGVTYALRDVHHTGRLSSAEEVSSIDLLSGATGPPALAEKMLVVTTCRHISVFL